MVVRGLAEYLKEVVSDFGDFQGCGWISGDPAWFLSASASNEAKVFL